MAYLLDANVFMSAKNLHYGFDFCPAFWEWLIHAHGTGKVFSIEKVGDEIGAGEDELSEWAAELAKGFFLSPDETVLPALGIVSQWVTNQQYTPAAINDFLNIADYYLVAQALAGGHVVVTHEKPADSVKRIKIPNVCLGVNVKCMTPFELLRKERARFVLADAGRPREANEPTSDFDKVVERAKRLGGEAVAKPTERREPKGGGDDA